MNRSRQHILASLAGEETPEIWAEKPIVPAAVDLPHTALVDMFIAKVLAARGIVDRVTAVTDVPATVADLAAKNGWENGLVINGALGNLPWSTAGVNQADLNLDADGIVAVTDCFAGVAETGTIVTLTGPDRDSRLNFVSKYHVVVLQAADIVGPYEAVWRKMQDNNIAVPRAVNFITGPSRTADIEQTIELGAHGPGSLHVILVGN